MNTTFGQRRDSLWLESVIPHPISSSYPSYYTPSPQLFPWIPDRELAITAPVVVYWIHSLFFSALDAFGKGWKWLDKYRIHDSEEVRSRNTVTKRKVLMVVLSQQATQTLVGFLFFTGGAHLRDIDHRRGMLKIVPPVVAIMEQLGVAPWAIDKEVPRVVAFVYWWLDPALRILLALLVYDTWQYAFHRLLHMNPFLYRHVHSWHHRLYVPYCFSAQFNHPFEGLVGDTIGAFIVQGLSGISIRQCILVFSLAAFKVVDDHSGYALPFHPFRLLFPNTPTFHDIHHQSWGMKKNFSQPFFVHWDDILGTRMTERELKARQSAKAE